MGPRRRAFGAVGDSVCVPPGMCVLSSNFSVLFCSVLFAAYSAHPALSRRLVRRAWRARPMAGSVDVNAFQGSACIGTTCFSPHNLTRTDWRSMLGAWQTEPVARKCRSHEDARCKLSPPALLVPCATPTRREYLQPCRRRDTHARTLGCSHSRGEEHLVMDLLGQMRNGTFVEIGGNDGMSTTNTYHLERCLGWHGILIEGHPDNFKRMARARPGALNLGTAVCREHGFANFTDRPGVSSGINSEMDSFHRKRFRISSHKVRQVPCGPLGDWFSALRVTTIDFFSLDVEGAEMVVLQTLNWDVLTIGVLLVECSGAGHYGCRSSSDVAIGSFLAARGLVQLGSYRARHDIWDLVFVNASHLNLDLAAWQGAGSRVRGNT